MSREADALRLSGLFGLVAGLGLGVYQMIVNDPMLPALHESVPHWMTVIHIHVLGLSLVVLLYSQYLDDVFSEYRVATVGAALIGQWVFPLTLYPIIALEVGLLGPVHNAAGLVMFLVAVAFAVNYARNGWGTAGT